jgi:YidC/Oxa1 family membrane protein insertase
LKALEDIIIALLNMFNTFTHSYGWSVILLTIAFKLVFYPLTKKQFQSMSRMKEIQPRLKELQEQHKGNPQQLQKEMMQLYKKHGVNPLGGCLPILLQMPILIGLFMSLNSAAFKEQVASAGQLSFLWIQDITMHHPQVWEAVVKDWTIVILPLLVGLSTYLTQKFMGNTDPKMAPLMTFMPLMMIFISFSLPAGVLLYWAVSNFISAWQQYGINKAAPQATVVKA